MWMYDQRERAEALGAIGGGWPLKIEMWLGEDGEWKWRLHERNGQYWDLVEFGGSVVMRDAADAAHVAYNTNAARIIANSAVPYEVPFDRDTDDVCDGADARPSDESLGIAGSENWEDEDGPDLTEMDYDPDEDRTP